MYIEVHADFNQTYYGKLYVLYTIYIPTHAFQHAIYTRCPSNQKSAVIEWFSNIELYSSSVIQYKKLRIHIHTVTYIQTYFIHGFAGTASMHFPLPRFWDYMDLSPHISPVSCQPTRLDCEMLITADKSKHKMLTTLVFKNGTIQLTPHKCLMVSFVGL